MLFSSVFLQVQCFTGLQQNSNQCLFYKLFYRYKFSSVHNIQLKRSNLM